jgi:hypothetical protein
MAYPAYIREKARDLRQTKKLTIDELAERLALPRTTIYYWVRDIPIPRTRDQALAQRRASRTTSRKAAALREVAYDEGVLTFHWFDGDPEFRDFVVLYIAEGYKRCRNRVSLANSDPQIIRLAWRWIDRFSCRPPFLSVQYHQDQRPVDLYRFWCEELGIGPDQVRLVPKSNSGRLSGRVWRCRHGVASVVSPDTLFRAELQAWMDCVASDWD